MTQLREGAGVGRPRGAAVRLANEKAMSRVQHSVWRLMDARDSAITGVISHAGRYQGKKGAEGEPKCPKMGGREAQWPLREHGASLGLHSRCPLRP